MSAPTAYLAILFKSVNQTMWADKILKEKGIAHKLIPVPRHISSDCGVCIRISPDGVEDTKQALGNVDGMDKIIPL